MTKLSLKREAELREEGTIARIYTKEGSVVKLITGREPHPVGRMVCVKAGMRAVAWESMRAEMPMIRLCEVASPVHTLKSQPHNLVMTVIGRRYPWRYRPDLELTTDVSFARSVASGTPFVDAVANWSPRSSNEGLTTLVVEVKDDEDPRIDDPEYLLKLELAKKVYRKLQWEFVTVVKSRDILRDDVAKAVRSLYLDHDASIGPGDINTLHQLFATREMVTLGETIRAFGGGVAGKAKASAMHVRRFLTIELSRGLAMDSVVRPIRDGRPIFEMEGRYAW
ncbi:MAG: hypothetical protein JWQ27_3342 [Ferruginibacter sp.]|nr:hypothetical protein [Ferruginibacter sp.]